jgi:hypothetical protein
MFEQTATKQHHFHSACSRFATTYSLAEVARGSGIGEQMLRNKLNPDQPHQLTVRDLVAIYHATGDDTLFDGMLFDCNLTAVAISPSRDTAPISHRVIHATAQVAGVGAQAVRVLESGRVTKGQRNALVGSLMATVEHLVLIATEVENKFQAVPGLACAADMARAALGA